jgi:hypothetical protein
MDSATTEAPAASVAEIARRYSELAQKLLADVERMQAARDEAVATGNLLLDELERNKSTSVHLDSALEGELDYAVSYLAGKSGTELDVETAVVEAENIAALAAALVERNR